MHRMLQPIVLHEDLSTDSMVVIQSALHDRILVWLRELTCLLASSSQELSVTDCSLDNEAVCALARFLGGAGAALEGLELEATPMDADAASVLFTALSTSGVCELSIVMNDTFTAQAMAALASALRGPVGAGLTCLDVSMTAIGPVGVTALASVLGDGCCPVLQRLDLDEVGAGGGIGSLAKVLQGGACRDLRALSLRENEVEAEDLWALRDAFRGGHCPELRELNLSNVSTAEEGAAAAGVMRALDGVPRLETLILSGTCLGDEGIQSLARAAEEGLLAGLRCLDLTNAEVSSHGCARLASALRRGRCPRLASLLLGGNDLGRGAAIALAEAMEAGALPQLTAVTVPEALKGREGGARLEQAVESRVCEGLEEIRFEGEEDLPVFAGWCGQMACSDEEGDGEEPAVECRHMGHDPRDTLCAYLHTRLW
jgi:hypothetical protein